MDSRRAQTLEALSAYIENQRSLLARTQADIERLKQLKKEIPTLSEPPAGAKNPQGSDGSVVELLEGGEKILELDSYHPNLAIPDKIDWQVFSSCDPTPLRTLAVRARLDHTQRSVPQPIQQSPLSALQKFVKDARKIIIDPVLESIYGASYSNTNTNTNTNVVPISIDNALNNPDSLHDRYSQPIPTLPASLSEDESEAHTPLVQESFNATRKRERARAKIRELKKRKIRPDLVVGCKLGEEGSDSVFVRHDIEDESAEVDVSVETMQPGLPTPVDGVSIQGDTSEVMDAESSLATSPAQSKLSSEQRDFGRRQRSASRQPIHPVESLTRSSRIRKPSLKLQPQTLAGLKDPSPALPSPSSLGKRSREPSEAKNATRKPKTELPSTPIDTNTESSKQRSDTYKQAWSVSEQHLLERLLDEIPDGERNRWAKISQAMGGKRTPRQVASRVQKYFEKLKRFGLDVDNGKGGTETMSTQRFDPNQAQNLVEIEKQFAVKAVEHAQTYWKLIENVNPRELKLTRLDDEIFEHVMSAFPELSENEYEKLIKLDEDWLKSEEGKKRWRAFINAYEKKVKDFNFGSLIRTDAREEYTENNATFVTRMQFYAVEIARNRLGLNDKIHELAKADAEKERQQKEASKKKGSS
ncbi:hypothetical protein ID866_6945 [Astraeus odoratus]|nr:hypothetical protein ID866_6945 [Astraeus odoratus]